MINDAISDQLVLVDRSEDIQVQQTQRQVSFSSFSQWLKLSIILTSITKTLYEDSNENVQTEDGNIILSEASIFKAPSLMKRVASGRYEDLVRFETDLSAWEASLPTWLKVPETASLLTLSEPPLFGVQAVALKTQ
jgi:hypothetical protein